ncbi:hypothetical protein SY27_13505 [Flavobacterium sp. 316]|uniref:Uncharacterized protein n=1 Tax=Flavobacterium sediminilitoris TaxID=2024526 RepID=A0ABY4HLP7_9FLAO|nr:MULTISPECIES: hypothetical protein [Flavobacterium]KIX20164.1 hypothetical protein SY27_13505 [Flavobacterium sp. 316]UOX33142.1 hypothetical protein LXD69_13975 [Flavobacterium sediminilitoris]
MSKYFRYLFFLLIITVFINGNSNDSHVTTNINDVSESFYNEFSQKVNNVAIQIKAENQFVEHLSSENTFSFKNTFSKFVASFSFKKELYFSTLIDLNRKKQNSFSIFFSTTQIIFPFHNFW